ncbi:MAG: hypothetical protein LBE11_00185 [Prevotellaceae bacterium]|jgi:outer membrane protein assembly factor BamA|nr:hypothetical protein [Prevotellaceae bacterium]
MKQKKANEDRNSMGYHVNWEVELWEWTNYLRRETEVKRKTFKTKIEAQKWIASRGEQGHVLQIRVFRLTYDNRDYPVLPTRKIMLEQGFNMPENRSNLDWK